MLREFVTRPLQLGADGQKQLQDPAAMDLLLGFETSPGTHGNSWRSAEGVLQLFRQKAGRDVLNFCEPCHVGGCQHYGPFLGPYKNTAPII